MTDIQQEMQNIRSHSQHSHEQSNQNLSPVHAETLSSPEADNMTKIRPLLDELAASFLAGDRELVRKSPMTGDLGFTIVKPEQQSWHDRSFYVTVTLKSANIEIIVSDGQWEQIPKFLGNWADWTDQKTIYKGPFDGNQIGKAIQQSFLSWYRHVYPVQ